MMFISRNLWPPPNDVHLKQSVASPQQDFHLKEQCSSQGAMLISRSNAHLKEQCSSQGTMLISRNNAHLKEQCSSQGTMLISRNNAHLKEQCSSQGAMFISRNLWPPPHSQTQYKVATTDKHFTTAPIRWHLSGMVVKELLALGTQILPAEMNKLIACMMCAMCNVYNLRRDLCVACLVDWVGSGLLPGCSAHTK